jgi:hypothetical protein
MKFLVCLLALSLVSCDQFNNAPPKAATGVKKATAVVQTDAKGHTIEQNNILGRYKEDNRSGSIKHLYVISAMSGQVVLYSTVKGKVTSSGKRLTPYSVTSIEGQMVGSSHEGIPVSIGGRSHYTSEVLQDDGTYGGSIPYVYWWDSKGVYHQHYVSGGQILHVSSKPIAVKGIIINMEVTE